MGPAEYQVEVEDDGRIVVVLAGCGRRVDLVMDADEAEDIADDLQAAADEARGLLLARSALGPIVSKAGRG